MPLSGLPFLLRVYFCLSSFCHVFFWSSASPRFILAGSRDLCLIYLKLNDLSNYSPKDSFPSVPARADWRSLEGIDYRFPAISSSCKMSCVVLVTNSNFSRKSICSVILPSANKFRMALSCARPCFKACE